MRSILTLAFVLSTLLGNVCSMPMVSAASMPMQHEDEMEMEMEMEMVMTPMIPMSFAVCAHCVKVTKQNDAPMNGSCAGHCFAKAHDTVAAVMSASFSHRISVAIPPEFLILVEPSYVPEKYIVSIAPPINLALARGVVMIN